MRPLRFTDVSTSHPALRRAPAFAHNYASFPVKRSWLPPFAKVATQEGHHSHEDSAFFDLDEPAMGAKQLVARAGTAAQRFVLGAGVYYSADGATHALHDLREWPQLHRNAAKARAAVDGPIAFHAALPQTQLDSACHNQEAMQRIAKTYKTNVYVKGICAGAQFFGCTFMGLGLSFDDVMLGSLVSTVVGYVETCMSAAVPNIVVYAAGVAAIASRDIFLNLGWETKQTRHEMRVDPGSLQDQANKIVQAIVTARQWVNIKAVIAGAALGIGVPLIFSIGAWGLIVMMPGALALPHILAQRHSVKLEPEDVVSGLNTGDLNAMANNIVFLDEQASNIEQHLAPDSPTVWYRMGLASPTFVDPVRNATTYMQARLNTTRKHLSYVYGQEADTATVSKTQASLQRYAAAQQGSDVDRDRYIFNEMVDALVDDGLFEKFALEVANSKAARPWLTTATDASTRINLSQNIIKNRLPAVGPDSSLNADETLHRRTQEMAVIFLRVMRSAGLHALESQTQEFTDLWLERLG